MNNKIFYIMGKSGSGKDTIFKYLVDVLCNEYDSENEGVCSIRPIIMNTTRPMRNGEKDGFTYNFVTEDMMMEDKVNEKILESREYNTVNGKWYYYTSKDSIDLDNHSYIGLGTPTSYFQLASVFGSNIIPIMLYIENNERFLRLVEREKVQTNPNYLELCRRMVADENDFSESVLSLYPFYGDIHIFENDVLPQCYRSIHDFIINILKNN